ncbi:multidrug effflux MFS transporter [bacterium]|nr:multidrug effflux MFS transporter [bacterium]
MSNTQRLAKSEFIVLMALMTSLIALSIDSMLPAFPQITEAFQLQSAEQLQLVIAILFLGFGFGQLLFGPLSDVFGRKPPIYWGIGVFVLGSILSGLTNSFELFLLGRFLQGFGAAAPRIISLALIRDEYSGNAMAQITSLVMTIFILVPAIAPTLGQAVIYFLNWRAIFILLFVMGTLLWVWFGFRQPETLPKSSRKKLSVAQLTFGLKETLSQPVTLACILMSGLLFGIFVGYLGAAQEIFSKLYQVGDQFPLYFGVLALSIGGASFFNSRLVMALGMRRLILYAFIFMSTLSMLFALYLTYFKISQPPFSLFMTYMILNFSSVGFLFGNLNALAMEPLGHIAGIGSALIGCIQSTISVAIGVLVGRYFHGSVAPLALGFGAVGITSILIIHLEKRWARAPRQEPRPHI